MAESIFRSLKAWYLCMDYCQYAKKYAGVGKIALVTSLDKITTMMQLEVLNVSHQIIFLFFFKINWCPWHLFFCFYFPSYQIQIWVWVNLLAPHPSEPIYSHKTHYLDSDSNWCLANFKKCKKISFLPTNFISIFLKKDKFLVFIVILILSFYLWLQSKKLVRSGCKRLISMTHNSFEFLC